MNITVLGSGSKGNSTLIEYDGVCLLIDAGLSKSKLEQQLHAVNKTPSSVDAVLITHEHSDHISGLSLLQHKGVTVYAQPDTISGHTTPAINGRTVGIGNISVTPFTAHHDKPALGFILDSGYYRVGYLTDTGHCDDNIIRSLYGSNTIILEANYEESLLQSGPYPQWLKNRIAGKRGHLSNTQAGELLKHCIWQGLERVILAHGSETNNRPDIAESVVRQALGNEIDIVVAQQHTTTGPFAPGASQQDKPQTTDADSHSVTVQAEIIQTEHLPRHTITENLLHQINAAKRPTDLRGVALALKNNPDRNVQQALRAKRRELTTMKVSTSAWF